MERVMRRYRDDHLVSRRVPWSQLILIILLLLATVGSAENRKADAAYLTKGLSDLSYKDGRIAFSMWMKELSANDEIDIDIHFYDTAQGVFKVYGASEVLLVGVNPAFYLDKHKQYDAWTSHYWAAQRGDDRLEKMVLLVRKDSGIDSLEALKGKVLVSREDNILGRVFLDKELLSVKKPVSKAYLENMPLVSKNSTAILKTYFGKADACVVPGYAFSLACEMNPALIQELKIVKESPQLFLSVLLLIRKDTDDFLYDTFARSATSLQKSARGESILALFKMKRLYELPRDELEPLKAYFDEYLELKQRYSAAHK